MNPTNQTTQYKYYPDLDLLYLADISPISVRGKYANGLNLNDGKGIGLIISIDEQGRSIGFEFFDAAELLLPHILPNKFQKTALNTGLEINYCPETDILTLRNGKPSIYSEPVTENWITHFNDDLDPYENWNVGEIVGFTLARVAQDILPHLLQYAPNIQYDPDKADRMRRFRKPNPEPARTPA